MRRGMISALSTGMFLARFNHPFSKLFEEERELTVLLLVDVSASSLFGTVHARKKLI